MANMDLFIFRSMLWHHCKFLPLRSVDQIKMICSDTKELELNLQG